VTWIAISFNGIALPASSVMNLQILMQFSLTPKILLFAAFCFVTLAGGLATADRLFSIRTGSVSQGSKRTGKNNILYRGIIRLLGEEVGILIVTSLKDFTRKLQNISKLMYALFLVCLIVPIVVYGPFAQIIDDPMFFIAMPLLTLGMMLGILGGIAFGGVGLFDSRDQLWILKSTSRGELKFILARVSSYLLLGIPYVIIPTVVYWVFLGFSPAEVGMTFFYAYSIIAGSIMLGIGITALNPTYDDTTSSAFTVNTLATIVISVISFMSGIVTGVIRLIRRTASLTEVLFIFGLPLLIIGFVFLVIGTYRLLKSEGV
jgi:hypothetical protein